MFRSPYKIAVKNASVERADSAATDDALGVDEESFSQYVAFYLGEECCAFPMATVLEIIRVPETVNVPLTPSGLVGLANLRGAVLPVVDLRRTLALDDRPYDDATRVIVVDCGRPVGLVVDRLARVLNVEPDCVASADSIQDTLRVDLLTGVVKNIDGFDLIQLLDAHRVVTMEFAAMSQPSDPSLATSSARAAVPGRETAAEKEEDIIQLVSLAVDEQEYAFVISDVDEIVRVPDQISHVPHADSHVLGLINLRHRLLPLVSLRRIFAFGELALNENNRVVVVRLGGKGENAERVGIVVDHVREVLRVPASVQEKVPGILSRGDVDEIGAICRLDDGKRLVSILSVGALLHHPAVQEAFDLHGQHAETDGQDSEEENDSVHDDHDEGEESQLVVYQLGEQEYGVAITSVQEIIRVPESLKRVPKTPRFVEGMINLRGSVLPVVDMRLRFELEHAERMDRQRILVLNVAGVKTGFIVDAVTEVLRISHATLEPAPKLSEERQRLIASVANLRDGQRMILVLQADALLSSGELDALSRQSKAPKAA